MHHECEAQVMYWIECITSDEWCNIQYSQANFAVVALLYIDLNEQIFALFFEKFNKVMDSSPLTMQ